MNLTQHETDLALMRRALELARRGVGQTRPNPAVGCVIVKEGRVIGEGHHRKAGLPHAEREALMACSEDPRGATMYVTLEPCAHTGRTPPCTDAVLQSGIARVVIAQEDPHRNAAGGAEKLRAAGVKVNIGLLTEEARLLNPGFNTYHMLERPLVTLKWAMSADGCTGAEGGHSTWITGPEARRRVHAMRARSDAVLVGVETALQDRAKLTIRDAEVPPGPPLLRVVLDSNLRIPPNHPLITEDSTTALLITAEDADIADERKLRVSGAAIERVARSENNAGLDLTQVLDVLQRRGVQEVFVEGGRRVSGAFFAADVVDRIEAFIAPVLIASGENPLSALRVQNPVTHMDNAVRLHHVHAEPVGDDVLLSGWVSRHLFEPQK